MFGRDQKSANDEPQEGVERKKEDEDSSNGSGEGGAAKGGEDANKGDDDDDLDDDDEGAPPGVELGEMEKGEEARLDFIVQMPTKEAISNDCESSVVGRPSCTKLKPLGECGGRKVCYLSLSLSLSLSVSGAASRHSFLFLLISRLFLFIPSPREPNPNNNTRTTNLNRPFGGDVPRVVLRHGRPRALLPRAAERTRTPPGAHRGGRLARRRLPHLPSA